jgi:hypothetical protein
MQTFPPSPSLSLHSFPNTQMLEECKTIQPQQQSNTHSNEENDNEVEKNDYTKPKPTPSKPAGNNNNNNHNDEKDSSSSGTSMTITTTTTTSKVTTTSSTSKPPTPRPSPRPSSRLRPTSTTTAEKVEDTSMAMQFVLLLSNDDQSSSKDDPMKEQSAFATVAKPSTTTEEEEEPGTTTTEEETTTTTTIINIPIEGKTPTSSESSSSINDTECMNGILYVCTIEKWCHLPDFEIRKEGKYWDMVWVEHGSCDGSGSSGGGSSDTGGGSGGTAGDGGDDGGELNSESLVVPSDPPCPYETWVAGPYSAGDRITAVNQTYVCKDPPFTPWCGMIGYQPGVDAHWAMAWDLEGDCTTARPTSSPTSPRPTEERSPPPIYQPTRPTLIASPTTMTTSTTPRPTSSKPVGTTFNTVESEALSTTTTTSKPTDRPVEPRPVPVVVTPQPTTTRPIPPTPNPTTKKPDAPRPTPPPLASSSTSTTTTSSSSGFVEIVKDKSTTQKVYDILEQKKSQIDSELFLYDTGTYGVFEESTVYRYRGFRDGLEVMHEEGVGDSFFYLGGGTDDDIGYKIGLVNIAAFIAQSMKETIKYDVCDENSWDLVNMRYPLSNACGQLGQSYQDYHCPENEKHMECKVDPNMKITATTHAKWYGAPAPLFCGSKKEYPFTGFWDYTIHCNNPWMDPPQYCDVYDGQKGGGFDNTAPVENTAGRTDVEGCCWWGRGVIQTTGIW